MKFVFSRLVLVAVLGLPAVAGAMEPVTDPPPRDMLPRPEGQMPGPMMAGVPGEQMPGADPFHLLLNSREVQEDLGLSESQLNGLRKAARNFYTTLQELSQPRPGVSAEKAQADLQAHLIETKGMIARELHSEQLVRLRQIILQLEGLCFVTTERELESELNLTPEQDRAITKTCQMRAAEMRDAFRPPRTAEEFCIAVAANRDRIKHIRESSEQNLMSLLSPEQGAIFEQMVGKRLPLEPPRPPECG